MEIQSFRKTAAMWIFFIKCLTSATKTYRFKPTWGYVNNKKDAIPLNMLIPCKGYAFSAKCLSVQLDRHCNVGQSKFANERLNWTFFKLLNIEQKVTGINRKSHLFSTLCHVWCPPPLPPRVLSVNDYKHALQPPTLHVSDTPTPFPSSSFLIRFEEGRM